MKKGIKTLKYLSTGFLLFAAMSCDNMLDVNLPTSELDSSTIYQSDETAEAAVNGIYASMVTSTYYNALHTVLGETSDELVLNTLLDNVYTSNEIPVDDSYMSSMWTELYKTIYDANAVIEGISSSATLTNALAVNWIGEAKFLRAYCYFYLVNLWGEIPLITTTDVEENALAERSSIASVYDQIMSDLNEATIALPEDYTNYSSNRSRATRWAAYALRARINLYLENWEEAESDASQVISQTSLFSLVTGLTSTNSPFILNSNEAILQLAYYNVTYTYEGSAVYTTSGTYMLRNGNSLFQSGDARLTNWTITVTGADNNTYLAPRKYKNSYSSTPSERSTLLRLAEVYLIRAEARVEQNNLDGAIQDLETIRSRAELTGSGAADDNDQASILAAIYSERQREFFAECGHRWLDLKRTGTVDSVLSGIKSQWSSNDALYPIPEKAINTNPNLTQNTGY